MDEYRWVCTVAHYLLLNLMRHICATFNCCFTHQKFVYKVFQEFQWKDFTEYFYT